MVPSVAPEEKGRKAEFSQCLKQSGNLAEKEKELKEPIWLLQEGKSEKRVVQAIQQMVEGQG